MNNIYKKLNKREKYILEKLNIEEEELVPENADSVLTAMLRMTKRISELPITEEQFISAIENYWILHNKIFKGIQFIASDADYPDIKVNVYKILSDENKKVIEMLGIKVEDREITSKEYAENLNILSNKLLLKYGTGIKQKECFKLTIKIRKYLFKSQVKTI